MNFFITDTMLLMNDENGTILENVNIFVKQGIIVDINSIAPPDFFDGIRINGKNSIVVPTFANAHLHLGETVFRGMCDGMNLVQYLRLSHSIYENQSVQNIEKIIHSISARATLAESALSGVGCVACSRGHDDVRTIGMKAVCGIPLIRIEKFNGYIENFYQHFSYNKLRDNDSLRTGIFIQGLKTISASDIKMLKNIRRTYENVIIMIHLSETQEDVDWCLKNYGVTPVSYIYENGLLTPDTLCVHLVYASDDDMSLIQKSGAKVVFCPSANLKLDSGIPPIEKFYKKRIPFSLATDGLSTVGSASLLEQAKMTSLLCGGRIPAKELFDSITVHPYEALGYKGMGRIEIGEHANFSLFTAKPSSFFPGTDMYSILIHNFHMFRCLYMWCDGLPVISDSALFRDIKIPNSEKYIAIFKDSIAQLTL